MEAPVARWFSEPGLELPSLIQPWEIRSIDQFTTEDIWDSFQRSFSSESYNFHAAFHPSNASNTFSSSSVETSYTDGAIRLSEKKSLPSILSFGNPETPKNCSNIFTNFSGGVLNTKEDFDVLVPCASKRNYDTMTGQDSKMVTVLSKTPSRCQDHVMAERKRRENLTQRFIALSSVIPGLKKLDKASILGAAIKYLKQLQEKVKILEDKAVKRTVEPEMLVKKFRLSTEDDVSSCDEDFHGHYSGDSLPDIEVKISEKTVLIRIQCQKHKGVLSKALFEIENLHLTITSTSAVPFTNSSFDVTITAQMDEEFSMTVTGIAKKLSTVFRQFM